MGDECSELVRFNEQWIQYVFLDFFSSYNIVFHLLCDNDLNIGIIDVLTMKLVWVKKVANWVHRLSIMNVRPVKLIN